MEKLENSDVTKECSLEGSRLCAPDPGADEEGCHSSESDPRGAPHQEAEDLARIPQPPTLLQTGGGRQTITSSNPCRHHGLWDK